MRRAQKYAAVLYSFGCVYAEYSYHLDFIKWKLSACIFILYRFTDFVSFWFCLILFILSCCMHDIWSGLPILLCITLLNSNFMIFLFPTFSENHIVLSHPMPNAQSSSAHAHRLSWPAYICILHICIQHTHIYISWWDRRWPATDNN